MTELQSKIQKSSRITAGVFGFLTIWPFLGLLGAAFNLYGLLGGPTNFGIRYSGEPLTGSLTELVLFTLSMVVVYGLATWGMLIARNLFLRISEERTPFNPIHVRSMRRITVISVIVIVGQALLEGWALRLIGGDFWLDMNVAWFLIPLVVFSFSFILDYACQLQSEADTTL